MDELDVRLCGLLNLNSCAPYRELADKLGLGLQAVHRPISPHEVNGAIGSTVGRFTE